MTELSRGANAAVSSPHLDLAVTGARQGTVDLMVFQLAGDTRRVRGDDDFVFFNQPVSPEGAVRLVGADRVAIELPQVPAAVDVLAVAVALDDSVPGSLAAVPGLAVTVRGQNDEHAAPALGLTSERAAVLVEIYRRGGQWKVRNVSAGWAAGLPALAREHGVVVDDAPTPAPVAPPRDELPPPVLPGAAPAAPPAWVAPSGGREPIPAGPPSGYAPPPPPPFGSGRAPVPAGPPSSGSGYGAPPATAPGYGAPPAAGPGAGTPPVGGGSVPGATAPPTGPATGGPGGWPPPGGSWTPAPVTPPASIGGYPPPGGDLSR